MMTVEIVIVALWVVAVARILMVGWLSVGPTVDARRAAELSAPRPAATQRRAGGTTAQAGRCSS